MTQHEARFGGIDRLFGKDSAERLAKAHVGVIGLGGVGSWAVEALARSGIGQITLVDLDDVCISNVNRQLHAVNGAFGKPKVEVMAERVRAINPECQVHARQEFFVESTSESILAGGFDYLFDAIDAISLKCLLISLCRERRIPLICAGAAGGRRDPTAIEVTDLAFSSHDRMLSQVRKDLRKRYGFPRGDQPLGVECVFSRESVMYPQTDGTVSCDRGSVTDFRIDCDTGFGTASFVTGVFGFVAAARIVQRIAQGGTTQVSRPVSSHSSTA